MHKPDIQVGYLKIEKDFLFFLVNHIKQIQIF